MAVRRMVSSPPRIAAASVLAAAALAALLAAGPAEAAAPLITGTDPARIVAGPTPHRNEFKVFGSGLVAPGTTSRTLPADVKLQFDAGAGWHEGQIVLPGRAWGAGELTVAIPQVHVPAGGLRIRVVVTGEASNVHPIPGFAPLPPSLPRILSVTPPVTAVGSSGEQFAIEVVGDGHGGTLLFNGAPPADCVLHRENQGRDVYRFAVPDALRGRPGRYPIQLENVSGKSAVAAWELVTRPAITNVAPEVIRVTAATSGAPTVTVMMSFSGSAPRSVLCRPDDSPEWMPVPFPLVFGEQVRFAIDLGVLRPRRRVEIRVANAAGDSTKSIPVVLEPPTPAPKAPPPLPAAGKADRRP